MIDEIRARIIKKLADLNEKMLTNEELPHGKQTLELLSDIEDKIEECLNNWYY